MKRSHNNLSDSDDDMDHLPLKYITSSYKKHESLNELRSYCLHACEFCEKVFENRYEYLIHNAKHIIIPLIKMLPHQCAKCGLCCISEDEMNAHMFVKHKIFIKPKQLRNENNKLKVPDACKPEPQHIEDGSIDDEKPLSYLIKNDKVGENKTENILKNFMMNCKVDIEKLVPTWQHKSEENFKSNDVIDTQQNDIKENVAKIRNSEKLCNRNNTVNSKKTIIEYISSTGKNNRIQTDVDNLNNQIDNNSLQTSDLDEDPIVILPPVNKEIVTDDNNGHESIHFNDLIKPGIFYCKRCFKRFPSRFDVIVHEIVHLDLSKAAPQKCNLDGEKHSANTKLPSNTATNSVNYSEEIFDNKTDNKTHGKTCFNFHCADCVQGFNETDQLVAHEATCNGESIINMCDSCLYLRKRPKQVRYYGISRFNNVEVKRVCYWCGKRCNEMSQVTLISRQRLADRIKFEGDVGEREIIGEKCEELKRVNDHDKIQNNGSNKRRRKRGHKILSNRERLKLIQLRLKLMKI